MVVHSQRHRTARTECAQNWVLLGKPAFLNQSRNYPRFVEPKGSLPCLQQPAACLCHQPAESSLCPLILSWNPVSVLSSHLHLALSSSFLHPDFSTKTCALLSCPMRATFLAHLDLFTRISPVRNELPLRFHVTLYNILIFWQHCLSPRPTFQARGPPLVGCLWLLIRPAVVAGAHAYSTVRAADGRGLLPSAVRCSEPSVYIQCGEFLGQPRNCQLLRRLFRGVR